MIALLNIDEIEEGAAKGLEVNNHHLFAVKKDAQIYLYRNRCPHLGTPLEWEEDHFLDADAVLIQCSNHGALFQITNGHCLAGPCTGKYLQSVPFLIENGIVMVEEELLAPRVIN
ncbi:MAG TPA: (2Fe-2S)-binding protein [Gammaproteobacteria bacterium]|mgnify:FL=1|jgi:nitrite reductase/ring-hydroxylating ferredoxin subunit|nr:Rieske 2Fe-2S domain-containing protein [Gammaproteobacteria bacterium]MDP6732157.1 Rieske 2Fe-2S domain-containing protein [Gammaproteobacteria bacterium]HAJ75192.1 (2Fe-2S)-binding protein [Gammaproteobacteria bacterium]|tara:strand:- start:2106 stop:2450 length:345 start_codon:yes stop_codon:yes gene_type:complete